MVLEVPGGRERRERSPNILGTELRKGPTPMEWGTRPKNKKNA